MNGFEISEEFLKMPQKQQLKAIYQNTKHISHIKRVQKMQWWAISGLYTAIIAVFYLLWGHAAK